MKHLAIFSETPPANFVEWWQAHTGCPDVFAQHVAWRAVKAFVDEVNAKAEAAMIVSGGEVHQAHGVAINQLLALFHSANTNNGSVKKNFEGGPMVVPPSLITFPRVSSEAVNK